MKERIEKELVLLRQQHPEMEYREEGRWVRISNYALPEGWNRSETDVAFQILPTFPGSPPYGIHVPVGIQFRGERPESYNEPAAVQPPFGGSWGQFSWQTVDGQWRATKEPDPVRGYTLAAWVKSFETRFKEGK